MKTNFKIPLLIMITLVPGFLVLLGYFFNQGSLKDLRGLLVNWAVILGAVAIIIGVVNLSRVHIHRIRTHQPGWFFSLILILSLLITLFMAGYYGPNANPSMFIFTYIQLPIEMSLLALLAVILVVSSIRLFRGKLSGYSLLFVGVVVAMILGTITIPGVDIPYLKDARNWLTQVWAGAGARGILIGIALGTIATAIQVLVGAERPYTDL